MTYIINTPSLILGRCPGRPAAVPATPGPLPGATELGLLWSPRDRCWGNPQGQLPWAARAAARAPQAAAGCLCGWLPVWLAAEPLQQQRVWLAPGPAAGSALGSATLGLQKSQRLQEVTESVTSTTSMTNRELYLGVLFAGSFQSHCWFIVPAGAKMCGLPC